MTLRLTEHLITELGLSEEMAIVLFGGCITLLDAMNRIEEVEERIREVKVFVKDYLAGIEKSPC